MIDFSGGCRRHRPALLDFVDRGEITPATSQALAHLDRCQPCTDQLETTVMAITALRRIGDEAARTEPPADAWPRLRARLDRWRPLRWAIMSPTTGTVMSLAIVAVLVIPLRIGSVNQPPITTAAPSERSAAVFIERRVEAKYISTMTRKGTFPAQSATVRSTGAVPKSYPDGILRPDRKEVSPVAPPERPLEAS